MYLKKLLYIIINYYKNYEYYYHTSRIELLNYDLVLELPSISNISFSKLFIFCFLIIFIGLFGILFSQQSILIVLMSIELVLLGISLLFIFFSIFFQNIEGQIFALVILTVAAAEAAAGLAILIVYNRLTKTIMLNKLQLLKG